MRRRGFNNLTAQNVAVIIMIHTQCTTTLFGERVVRSLVRPYWCPEFDSRCRQGVNCDWQYRDFFNFSRGSPVSPIQSHQPSLLLNSPFHFISCFHSFISSFISFTVNFVWRIIMLLDVGRAPCAPPLTRSLSEHRLEQNGSVRTMLEMFIQGTQIQVKHDTYLARFT